MKSQALAIVILWTAATQAQAASVIGDVTRFQSPRGVSESCVAINKLPLGKYSEKDIEKEKEFCSLDFYNNSVALCPKVWSTSPGTIVNDISKTGKTSQQAEASLCIANSPLSSVAKFKQTMNFPDTSGTYSLSSILYYHFSRALDATIDVPVAVYRSMDKDAHYSRVSVKANPPAAAKMNTAGWKRVRDAELKPASFSPIGDFFTDDRQQIYGVLLKDKGERYGVEINGTRASGWGQGQNFDFQKTPAFLALKSALPLREAIQEGASLAFKDPAMSRAFAGTRPSETQVALWMRELSEIAILDYIFSQQDRVGNVDYVWFWVFKDNNGQIKTMKASEKLSLLKKSLMKAPAEIADFHPILVQKTSLGDNDAGGLPNYANFTKSTKMLEGIRHLNAETYRRLYNLALDFEKKGPNYQALSEGFGLRADSLKQTIANTKLAAAILLKSCETKQLRFDLVSYKDAYLQKYEETTLDCRNP